MSTSNQMKNLKHKITATTRDKTITTLTNLSTVNQTMVALNRVYTHSISSITGLILLLYVLTGIVPVSCRVVYVTESEPRVVQVPNEGNIVHIDLSQFETNPPMGYAQQTYSDQQQQRNLPDVNNIQYHEAQIYNTQQQPEPNYNMHQQHETQIYNTDSQYNMPPQYDAQVYNTPPQQYGAQIYNTPLQQYDMQTSNTPQHQAMQQPVIQEPIIIQPAIIQQPVPQQQVSQQPVIEQAMKVNPPVYFDETMILPVAVTQNNQPPNYVGDRIIGEVKLDNAAQAPKETKDTRVAAGAAVKSDTCSKKTTTSKGGSGGSANKSNTAKSSTKAKSAENLISSGLLVLLQIMAAS
ncbi:hypothetical protein CDIK_3214 [Cucumispora dikerogammari]|nr:hypothetical protein CDIK_3214 [Cucumispora dikerogammari]